jgi:hypothetical protein
LRTLDLAVEVRTARLDRAELDGAFHELLLDLVREEFPSSIGLDALDGKRELLDDLSRNVRVFMAVRF